MSYGGNLGIPSLLLYAAKYPKSLKQHRSQIDFVNFHEGVGSIELTRDVTLFVYDLDLKINHNLGISNDGSRAVIANGFMPESEYYKKDGSVNSDDPADLLFGKLSLDIPLDGIFIMKSIPKHQLNDHANEIYHAVKNGALRNFTTLKNGYSDDTYISVGDAAEMFFRANNYSINNQDEVAMIVPVKRINPDGVSLEDKLGDASQPIPDHLYPFDSD